MQREELATLPLEHPWTREALRDHFAVVMGGVALPTRRPGFAVVAGLCHPQAENDLEIHVLAEMESLDLGELLRSCHSLGGQYGLRKTPDERFSWIGDGKHKGAQEIIWRVNREAGNEYNRLDIQYTMMLENPTPYLSMFALLSELTDMDRKHLYLHDCAAGYAMHEVPSDEVADTRLGDYPAIEALAFVVDALRTWLEYQANRRAGGNTSPYRNWARFRRGKVRAGM